ncbi:hypothetical protein A8144_00945 [Mycobacterium leprae 3125609]|nr:hypothetical protein A8144_00945 [Mycobacterium leprae 3125609]OAX72329.1 hypothetical protein A3216_01020 [Mycobacterium leprae 7935681]
MTFASVRWWSNFVHAKDKMMERVNTPVILCVRWNRISKINSIDHDVTLAVHDPLFDAEKPKVKLLEQLIESTD